MPNHQKFMRKRYQSFSDLEKIQNNERKYQQTVYPKYQERVWLNNNQYQFYRSAMFGLKAYSKNEIYKMSVSVKRKIIKLYNKAQIVLNRWKQQLINEMFEKLCSIKCTKFSYNPFNNVFKDTNFGVEAFGKTTDDSFICTLSFTDLRITKEQIINKLIENAVLPVNFYQLK